MNFFLLLLLLGIATYWIVGRSVAGVTRTPIWILWLVMMAPPFIWTIWILVYGRNNQMPPAMLVAVFSMALFLYTWLIQKGRIESGPPESQVNGNSASQEAGKTDAAPLKIRPITKEEEVQLRECFPWGVYHLQNLDFRPQAVICRGQLRTKPEVAYKTIRENIEAKFGDRFLIIFQEGFNGSPFFALVPNPQASPQAKHNSELLTRPGLAIGLLVATLLTTIKIGTHIAGFSDAQLESNALLLLQGIPYALALLAILGVHEMGHYLTARYYKLRISLPYFIPIPFLPGTFGAFIQMRSLSPDRKALFDIGIAGPLAGFVVTLPLLIWGLANSTLVPLSAKANLFNFDALTPNFSLLLTLLSKLALGSQLTASKAIDLHPVAVAGYIGLIVTAFNLMPVGQLDGGHIVHAMFGQKQAMTIGQISRILLFIAAAMPFLVGISIIPPSYLFWAVFLFLIPLYDEPALNDISELDNKRDLLGLFALTILLLIILPAPRFLTGLLGM